MTSRDFRLIAAAMAHARAMCETRSQTRGVERAVASLVDALLITNPRFDRERFVRACYGAGETGDSPRARDYSHVDEMPERDTFEG